MTRLRASTPASLDYEPATTAWQPGPTMPRAESASTRPPERAATLLAQVAAALGWTDALGEDAWEQTMRLLPSGDDEAVGVILQWGLMDDAVAGRDLRVHMRRLDGGWVVESIEQRFHCRRGMSAAGLCS